jgi:peptidoglycan lytic transglycosylase
MSCIECARTSYMDFCKSRIRVDMGLLRVADFRKRIQFCAVALGAVSLAGCAQSVVTQQSELRGSTQPVVAPHRNAQVAAHARVKLARKIQSRDKSTAENRAARHRVASFYTEGTETASGEKFDTHELTAAHRTLPFGTRLRVTNVSTGRSVTVRVNDRGPFIPGRDVDVSYSAAEALGIVDKGVANVKLDVVR